MPPYSARAVSMQGRLVGCSSRTPTAALEVLARHAERPQVLHREVDASAPQVLADVADEVAELEGDPEVAGVRVGDLAGNQRLEDRHHLQPDDGRGPVD